MADKPGSNGTKRTPANLVAAQLMELVSDLRENRAQIASHEVRVEGLVKVILRPNIPFGHEQIEQIASVIDESGDIDSARSALKHKRAAALRRIAGR